LLAILDKRSTDVDDEHQSADGHADAAGGEDTSPPTNIADAELYAIDPGASAWVTDAVVVGAHRSGSCWPSLWPNSPCRRWRRPVRWHRFAWRG